MAPLLLQIIIYLGAALIAVTIAARLGLGSVLGYILAGIIIGPLFGIVGNETSALQHFAEFGVVMMLFVIGLELEPRHLWQIRHKLLGLGGLQISLTIAAFASIALFLGLSWQIALAIGMIFALSSTAIVLQTLNERSLLSSNGGRSSFSVLLMQDVAVIPMLAIIPLLMLPDLTAESAAYAAQNKGYHDGQFLADAPGWLSALAIIAVIGGIILAGNFLAGPLFGILHGARVRELFTAFTLLIVFGISYLMLRLGLSPALGAFLAGVVLANSEFKHQLESDIEPFKGLLLGLFFITVGAGIDFTVLLADPLLITMMMAGVILIKAGILYLIARLFHMQGGSRWLFTLSLAQAGEFGFVLIAFSLQQNVLPYDLGQQLLLVVALSMLVTPLLFIAHEQIEKRLARAGVTPDADEVDETGPVIIVGVGRFGQIVNRLVRNSGIRTVVLDNNLKIINLMKRFGFKVYLGDPTRPDILKAAGLAEAAVLMVALDNPEDAVKLVLYARKQRPDLTIVARAHDRAHMYELHQAGATHIVRELFDASLRAGRHVLEGVGLTSYEAEQAEKAFASHDEYALQELAESWRKDMSATQNDAYIAKARELEQELEAAILAALQPKG